MRMFGLPSLRLGRLFGIPIELDASWFFVLFLVAASLTTSYFPEALPDQPPALYAAIGLLTALVFFGSLIGHEFAHSLVAKAGGLRIRRVTLFMFGGVSQMDEEPRSPGQELLVALAGPAASLLFAVAFWGLAFLARALDSPVAVWVPLDYLAVINVSLAVFNLLPGFPLDGGRVLRAVFWAGTKDLLKATRWASRAGQAIGMALVAIAVLGVLGGSFDLVWLAVMGWFLSVLAGGAYEQQKVRSALAAVPVSAIMTSPPVLAPADATLEEIAHSYFLGGRHRRYPVVDDGRVIGIIDLERSGAIPREQWATVTAAEAAARDLSEVVAVPDASVESVLTLLEPSGPGAVLVVEDGRLAGIVTRADVIRAMREAADAGSTPR